MYFAAMYFTVVALILITNVGASQTCIASGSKGCVTDTCVDDTDLLQHPPPSQSHAEVHKILNNHLDVPPMNAPQMETMIMELAQRDISGKEPIADTTKLLNDVDTEMKKIIDGAGDTRKLLQADVDRAKLEVETCGADADTSHTESEGVNSLFSGLASQRNAHNSCRDGEKELYHAKTSKCTALTNFVAGLEPPDCYGSKVTAMSQEAFRECGEQLTQFFSPNEQTWKTRAMACSVAASEHSRKREVCEARQGSMESAFCVYESSLSLVCREQVRCRAAQIGFRTKVHEDVTVAEAALKANYLSARKVKCVIQVFTADKASKSDLFKGCTSTVVDASHLDVTYHPIPEAATCDLSTIASKPCDAAWVSAEYHDKGWSEDAPAHSCISCPAPPTTTTTTSAVGRAESGFRGGHQSNEEVITEEARLVGSDLVVPGRYFLNMITANDKTYFFLMGNHEFQQFFKIDVDQGLIQQVGALPRQYFGSRGEMDIRRCKDVGTRILCFRDGKAAELDTTSDTVITKEMEGGATVQYEGSVPPVEFAGKLWWFPRWGRDFVSYDIETSTWAKTNLPGYRSSPGHQFGFWDRLGRVALFGDLAVGFKVRSIGNTDVHVMMVNMSAWSVETILCGKTPGMRQYDYWAWYRVGDKLINPPAMGNRFIVFDIPSKACTLEPLPATFVPHKTTYGYDRALGSGEVVSDVAYFFPNDASNKVIAVGPTGQPQFVGSQTLGEVAPWRENVKKGGHGCFYQENYAYMEKVIHTCHEENHGMIEFDTATKTLNHIEFPQKMNGISYRAGGSLFFSMPNGDSILRYDIANRKFRTIPLPTQLSSAYWGTEGLAVKGKLLASTAKGILILEANNSARTASE